jgi:hypothetical protein
MRVNSNILNTGDRIHLHSILMDQRNLKGLIAEYKGNDGGMYFLPGEQAKQAYIPAVEDALKGIDIKFKKENQQIVNSGRPPLEGLPPHLTEKKHKLEAELDVLREELECLTSNTPGQIYL